jgi:hypothetical protein
MKRLDGCCAVDEHVVCEHKREPVIAEGQEPIPQVWLGIENKKADQQSAERVSSVVTALPPKCPRGAG